MCRPWPTCSSTTVVHHQPLPGSPDVMGKLPLIAFYQTAEAQGWEKIEPLAEWGYDDLTVAVVENTSATRNSRSVGVARWRDGKITELWTVGLRRSSPEVAAAARSSRSTAPTHHSWPRPGRPRPVAAAGASLVESPVVPTKSMILTEQLGQLAGGADLPRRSGRKSSSTTTSRPSASWAAATTRPVRCRSRVVDGVHPDRRGRPLSADDLPFDRAPEAPRRPPGYGDSGSRRRAAADRCDRVSLEGQGPAPPRRRGDLLGGATRGQPLWGTRGPLPRPADTVRYGGNTSCVEVRAADGSRGVRRRHRHPLLGARPRPPGRRPAHALHMDHIQGLGFFAPCSEQDAKCISGAPVHARRPPARAAHRYLSPPLFPCGSATCRAGSGCTTYPSNIRDPRLHGERRPRVPPGPDGRLPRRRRHGHRRLPARPRAGPRRPGDLPVDVGAGTGGGPTCFHDTQYADDEYDEHVRMDTQLDRPGRRLRPLRRRGPARAVPLRPLATADDALDVRFDRRSCITRPTTCRSTRPRKAARSDCPEWSASEVCARVSASQGRR